MITQVARPGAGLFFGAVLLLGLLGASRTPITGDARVSLRAAQRWLDTGHMALSDDDFKLYNLLPSPDGKRYSKYPLLAFVQSVPAAWFISRFGDAATALGFVVLALLPAAWTAWFALGLALLLARLGVTWRSALGCSALLVVSTPLWVYGRSYYGESSQAALLIWALLCAHAAHAAHDAHDAHDDPRWALAAGGIAGALLAAKPSFALIVPCLALTLPLRHLRHFALGLAPVLALVAAYNWARYQDVLAFGYGGGRDGTLGFATPLYVGLFGNFLSPGKSVFLYAPILLLAPSRVRALLKTQPRFWYFGWALPLVIQVVLVSKWWAWSGDLAWGPRLLTPFIAWLALPALVACAKQPRARAGLVALVGLGAAGVLVQAPAMLLSDASYPQQLWHLTHPALQALTSDTHALADDTLLAHYVPWLSPIVAQWWLLCAKLVDAQRLGTPPWAGNGFDQLAAVPPEPPWNLWFDGSPSAWLLALGLSAASALLVWRLHRLTTSQPA